MGPILDAIGQWNFYMFILFHNKVFVRKNSEPFMNNLFLSQSSEALSVEQNHSLDVSIESSQMTASHSLHMLVSTMLSDKKPEEVREIKLRKRKKMCVIGPYQYMEGENNLPLPT
ncbi:kinesin-4-like isoform X1 [Carex littledalei]|uniref:Kinesin-4-like isoform X1 n=1 Tax=Carex littledalei TaxID=544730 RepID=A0A833VNF4_9POAL|nr:kinesin-4-like isoform X1 [Carex littledalei]